MDERKACPRCGYVGSEGAECDRCGIVFDKVSRPARPREMATPAMGDAGEERRGFGLAPILLAVAALGSAAYLFFAHSPAPKPRRPVADASPVPTPPAEAAPVSALPLPPPPAMEEPVSTPRTAEAQASPAPPETPIPFPTPTVATAEPPASSAPPTPEPFTETYEWYRGPEGFRRAAAESAASGRAIFVYVYTDWCPYCRQFEGELLETAAVKYYLRAFPKVRVNPETTAGASSLANQLGVRGYPTFMMLRPGAGTATHVPRMTADGDRPRLKTPQEFVAACRSLSGQP